MSDREKHISKLWKLHFKHGDLTYEVIGILKVVKTNERLRSTESISLVQERPVRSLIVGFARRRPHLALFSVDCVYIFLKLKCSHRECVKKLCLLRALWLQQLLLSYFCLGQAHTPSQS